MNKFKVIIEETVSDIFEVDAVSTEEAINIAIEKYRAGIFVLEPGNLVTKQLSIINSTEETEWIEF